MNGEKESVEESILSNQDPDVVARHAMTDVRPDATDRELRARAQLAGEAFMRRLVATNKWRAAQKIVDTTPEPQEGDDPKETELRQTASFKAIEKCLADVDSEGIPTGRFDRLGTMWKQGGFSTGVEAYSFMRNLLANGPEAGLTDDYKDFYSRDWAGQVAIAREKRGLMKKITSAAGKTADALANGFQTAALTDDELRGAPEDVIDAHKILLERDTKQLIDKAGTDPLGMVAASSIPKNPYMPDERTIEAERRVDEYRRQLEDESIRSEYAMELNRKNAWTAFAALMPTLSKDAQGCAKAMIDSADGALPMKYSAAFENLPEKEQNTLILVRQLLKERVESNVGNTIGDALIGAANVTLNLLTSTYRQGAKIGNMIAGLYDAGVDVNELAKRRQKLYQATGNFFAGGDLSSGTLPQLQFERICEDHGILAEAVIGAISTLPYMYAASIKGAKLERLSASGRIGSIAARAGTVATSGSAIVALEAMQEFDDHTTLNGGDITSPGYIAGSFIMGGLYAYIEKLQVEGLLGGISEQAVREGMLKGFLSGIKNGTVPRVLLSETLSESVQEGLQNGVMAIHEALALGKSVPKEFGSAFVEDFVGSLGTMAIIGAGGIVKGHMGRSGWHIRGNGTMSASELRHFERSKNLTDVYLAEFAHNNMVELSGRSDEYRLAQLQKQQQSLFEFWKKGGKDGLIENAGISDRAADNLDRLFTAMREAEGATAKVDEALQEWNRGRGVTSAPKAGESGDIGQQYLEQLVGGAIRGEISEEDFVGRLMDLGFSARGARDYATFTTLENSVVTEQKAIQSFLQGRYEREAESEDAQNADYEKVQGAIRDLDRARSVWAQGFGIYRSEEDGKITDPGAAALEKFGFTKEDAKRISKLFHHERAAAFSPIALDGIRAMYERATRGKVSAKAAIASEFQGRVVRLSTGTDAKGKPVYGDFIRFTRNGQTGYVQILDSKTGAPDFSEGNVLIAESIAEATKHKKTPITVQQWMDATPAERENLWNQYHLYDEGFFTEMTPTELTVAADPSARVDSEQAKILLYGTITLATDPSFSGDRRTLDTIRTVDSSAGFHEIYHAWSYFMQQTGKWSEKDDEELQKKYGRAKSGGHNEEAAANALRAYINRRIEGRMTGEDEKSPFAKIFALAKQLRRHADEKRVKARAAATAEETFFDQIIVDNFTGVGEISKQPEAPKPAENAKTSTPTAPQMPGRTDKGTDKGATEPEKKPEPAEKPAEPEKPKATPKPAAQRGWTAYTPTGNVKVGGHYAVVNLSEVIHSNNPAYALYMRAQLRNRKDNKAEEDTRKDIVNNFQGERLLEAPDTANGAPIVFIAPDEKGVKRMFVLSGNGRILVLNELAERHMYDKYRNVMKAWAAENGLEVPEGETPVLVRVITDLGGSTLEKVADLSNTNSIQQYTEEEQARADAEIIKSLGIARLYHANVNGSPDMTPGVNDDFFAEFIRGVGDTSLYNSDRSLTETARIRAVRALLAITVGQGERGRDVVKKLIEQTDTLNIVRQKNAAAIMAAAVAGLETNDAYSIGPDVSRAMADYIDFAEKKKAGKVGTFDEYFAQMDLIDGPSEIAREILKLFGSKQSASDIAEYVNKYCEAAAQSDPTGGLFGEEGVRTRIQIWNDAVKTVDEARSKDAERHSVATLEDPGITKPYDLITEKEMDLIAAETGTTDDPANVGFILPDGRLVKYLSHIACVQPVIFSRGIRYSEHSGYRMVGTALKSGMVRTGGLSRAWIQLGAKPSQKQRDAIRDYMEAQRKSSHYSDFTIEVEGKDNVFHSATYSLKVSPSRIFDDIDNFYDNGIEPQGQSFLSQFFHWSIASCDFEAMNRYYDGDVRSIARMLKAGDGTAIAMAAGAMARAIRPGDVLIPVPSHDGRAHDTLLLADAISRITGSPVVEAIRGTVRDPIYDLKARGYLPDAEDLGFYRAADIPEDRRAVFIDNVVGTGTTAVAARQALGRGHVVAFAWDHMAPHPVGIVGGLAERHSITAEEDAAHADAIKRGDIKTAARLVREAAERSGYVTDSSYQGTTAFNGAAPSANGYYANKEERKAAWEDGSFEGETTFGDYIFDGIDINNLDYILGDERYRRYVTPERKEAVDNLRKVLSAKSKTIRMYRSVPSNVKEGSFRNGDWITPSRSYAVENARIHGWEEDYRIIEQDVSVEDIWWDGNDVAEWGYDDGKEYAYRNTPNNRKLLTPATYDEAGGLIPLSQRFNPKNPDIRYSFAIGEVGAANLQDALFTAANLKKARELLAGRDWAKIPRPERIRIKFATGWEVGADGKWRMEKPDLPPVSLRKFKVDQSGDPKPTKEMTAEDEGATNLPYLPTTLGKLFPKAELFSSYPWLKSTKVLLGSLPQDGSLRGSYNEESGEIKLRFSKAENAETIHTTLVHEIQHAIQRIEDFARGGNRGIVQKIFMERFKKAKEEAWPLYHEEHDLANRYLPWNERYKYTGWPKRHPERIAALEKLRTFEEYRDWERRAADFKKKWKHGIDFFTDSDFTAWGRAFKTSFKDYTKLAGEVEARNAAARHYKTILDLRGAYAAKPDFPVLLEDTEDVDRRYQTLLNGAMEQFEKLKSQEDRDARHSFAGVRAANLAGVGSLDDAEVLEKRGEDRETIFKLTGWWRGVDGHWRVELPFHGRFELEGDFDQGTEKGYRTISDYFEWEELFSSYPELRDVEVRFEDMPDEIRGDFDPKTKTIRINKSLRKESANVPAKLKVASVMVHEIQHAIQSIENHARGGDPEQFLTWDATKIHDEIRRLELQRELTDDADEKESIDEMIQEHEIALRSDAEDAERKYYSLAGEVEARNAAERFFESPSYRLTNPPWTTQDTFDNQQILDFEPDGAQWSADIIDNGSGKDRYSIVSRLDEEREKIEAEGGKLLLAFHGTQQGGFTRFDQEKNDDGQLGFFFSSDRDTAMTYSSAEKYDPYDDDYSPAMFEDGNALYNAHGIYNVALRMTKPIEIEGNGAAWHSVPDPFSKDGAKAKTREIVAKAFEKGYDGVIFKNIIDNGAGAMSGNLPPSNVYAVRDPEQVKSVDSVTYDDAGRIIPDARRLDWGSGDIRYSIQAWPENFPKVKIVTTLDFIKRKHEDLHKRAKAGSLGAAMELVDSIIGPATIKGKPNPKWDSIRSLAADYPGATLVPVQAEEATGHNMIPFAYAYKIYDMTGLKMNKTIRQVVRANHTGSDALWRMTHRPEFIGNVMRGHTYIIIDDHVTMGGTLNELRKHIQDRGGKVVAATTLTASRFSDILSLRQGTLEKLAAKFGKDLGKELHEAGIANVPAELTEAEARYLLKLSPDTLRDRLNGSALERRALGSLAEGSVQARVVRSTVLPGAAGGVGDRANGSSGSGRSSASHVNDFPGFSEYKDPDGNFGPTRWAKAEIFNGRISKELNKVIDEALGARDLPGEAKLEELTKLIERAKATKEGKLVLERYKSGDSFDGSEAQKNDPKRQAIWQQIRQELILDPISSVNNEGLAVSKKTGKPKNASTIEASNAANPDLPEIANDATASYDPICDRRLDIVIGPPAAGKSSVFVDRLSIYYRSRVMDSDAIKQRLPGFDKGNGASYVHEESSYVNKMLLAELLEANKGENIVLPIVGSTAKKIRSYIDMFRNRGYTIYLHNNYVPIVHAFARALVRTTSTGRWIAPEVFLDCLDRPSAAFEEVKDEVDGWDEFSNDVPLGMEPIPARGNYKDPAYGTIEFAGEKIEAPSDIKVTPQLVFDFANALDLEEEFRKPIFPKSPRQGMLDFGDAESRSRHAIRSDLQENTNKAAEEALTNYLTYFRLSHSGKPRANTIARMGLAMGMNVFSPKRLLDKAESRAEQVRGTLIEKAAANGDVATTLALLKREDGVDDAVSKLIAGGISKGGELTHKGVGQINSIIGKRVEQMMRDFTAASLADMEGETGLDIAAEILEQNPDAFADEVKKAKGTDPEKPQDDEGSDTDVPGGDAGDESGLSDYERHKRAVAREEALKKVEAFIAAAKARAAENKAKAEERRKRHETVDLPGDGNGEESDGEAGLPRGDRFDPTPKNVKANFKSKEEFAAFMRVWAEHKFDETHGISTLGKTERDKLFAEFYRITVKQELQDLADKLLAPKDENGVTISRIAKLGNGARVHVNRRLAEMEKGVRPDTIERMSAEIFAFINSAAIRVSRTDLVKEFKKLIRDGYIKGAKYEDLKLDADRRVTGWVEEAARYICRVCDLSKREINGLPSQLAAERKELHDIINRRADVYDESGKQVAKAAVEDMETKKAMWKLALLDKYGAMTSLMPGEILDLQNQAIEYLDKQAADLEQLWRDTRAYEEGIRRDLTAAIVAPGGQRYKEKGWLDGRLFDALNGLIRLRLQHLTRFASDADRQKASEAINKIIVMLGDGETQYNRALQDDRRALFEGLGRIFQKPEGGVDNAAIKKYLDRMTQPIPKALAQQISNQGFADSMTYGQMLQLLVSLEQRSFREAIEHNGRQGQADLIRNFETADEKGVRSKVFTAEDNQFVEWLRAFYAAKRDVISPVTLRMVGQKVDSPDPLYCPAKRLMEDRVQALAEAGSSWDPIAAVFTRRIRNNRDFDEQASVIGMFFDRSDETARLLAWAERGTVIRGVFTSVGVQSAIRRAFGPGELRKIMTQLLATFNGGESRKKSPGELAAVDKALNFTTYAYLGFNPLSAIKQMTSFTVWANALPGGFRDLWKYMSHFDRAALKHLKESDEYKLRYGNDVGSGQDLATKGLNENPGMNPVARMLSGAGMWLLKKGDFAPGGWIAQGLYKDLLNKHLNEGMEFDSADRLAITETFNMLEETQQSGRTYNTNMLTIEHGRIGRLLTQFATSPLQQLQYETQAYREWRDMVRYNMGEKKIAAARQKLVRAVVINHLLLPAALNFVTAMFKLAMGDEPPWEKDGYHWSILTDILMGQFSRVFFIGAFSQTALKALFMREYPRGSQMLPVEGALGMAASVCITAHDVATLNAENIRKDLERLLKATAPTRIPYGIYRRLVGDSDVDRKKAKKGSAKK